MTRLDELIASLTEDDVKICHDIMLNGCYRYRCKNVKSISGIRCCLTVEDCDVIHKEWNIPPLGSRGNLKPESEKKVMKMLLSNLL